MAMEKDRREHVVPVREDIGLDRYGVADDALGGKTSVIDDGSNALDDDTATPIDILRHESASCEGRALIGERRAARGGRSMGRVTRREDAPMYGRRG